MNAVKILIVEDEALVAMDIGDMLGRLGYEVLPSAMSYEDAATALENLQPDLVLVDINLAGEKSGIDLGHLIRSRYQVPFIFITSHSDRSTVSLAAALQPNGYLVKPFEQEDIFTAIEMALTAYTIKEEEEAAARAGKKKMLEDCLFVKTDRNYIKIRVQDILWLQSDHNYIHIVTGKGKKIVRSNFRELLLNLPAEQFIQVHKSYMVNINAIDAVSHTEVIIQETEIPLSRNFKDELLGRLNRIL